MRTSPLKPPWTRPWVEVWRAHTSPDDVQRWNTASDGWHTTQAAADLRVGGAFTSRMAAKDGSFGFDLAGTCTQIVPNALIGDVVGDRAGLVEFLPGPSGVTVRVTFEPEADNSVEQQRQGWQAILHKVKRHVDSRH